MWRTFVQADLSRKHSRNLRPCRAPPTWESGNKMYFMTDDRSKITALPVHDPFTLCPYARMLFRIQRAFRTSQIPFDPRSVQASRWTARTMRPGATKIHGMRASLMEHLSQTSYQHTSFWNFETRSYLKKTIAHACVLRRDSVLDSRKN